MQNHTIFFVTVIPKSSKNEIVSWEHDVLKVKLCVVPEKGKANEALIRLLAKELKIPKSSISITHGLTNRKKKILIEIPAHEIHDRFDAFFLKKQPSKQRKQ